ncbi:hypothetical protein [Kitasatospora purpeofusca]|uniref:hypothetical protein n=1 Tax=Kitasatospora purpeofusca TaxID=67352 RepID=UPI003813856C
MSRVSDQQSAHNPVDNVAVNAWMAALSAAAPDITKWFDRDVWTKALENNGYTVTRS